jgi:diguanylate cyclase (GGDEF)-like protein/PAS domain S-box-containing protein
MPLSKLTLQEFAQLGDAVPAMLGCFDAADFSCLYLNERYAAWFNTSPAAAVGKSFTELAGERAAADLNPHVEAMRRGQTTVRYQRNFHTPAGVERWIEVQLVASSDLPPTRVYVSVFDVTERTVAERAAIDNAGRLSKFFEASDEGVVFHENGRITDVNPSLTRLLGYSMQEMLGRSTLDFVGPADRGAVSAVIARGEEATYESSVLTKSGEIKPTEFIVRDMVWQGKPQRMVIVRDLTRRNAVESRIRFLALNDPLTGLPNRAQLDERLSQLIRRCQSQPIKLATLFLDLDQVKRVNDSLGHAAGDDLLCEIADRLSKVCAMASPLDDEAWLARLGGDEFVATYMYETDGQLELFVQQITSAFNAPLFVQHRELRISASIGVALYPQHGNTSSELLKNADAAMYLAKTQGRATVRYFDPSLALAADLALDIEHELTEAIKAQQFELYFQPLLSADGRALHSVEALIRWQHPLHGLISPDRFIKVAEESQLILPMGQWVIQEALAQVKPWVEAGWAGAKVAVNLSTNQFRETDFVAGVKTALVAAKVGGERLEIELTERMVMNESDTVRRALAQLKALGIALAVDDFGTGLSSLSRLQSLPIDQLKIDQSFVSALPESHSALAIVTSLVQLGRGLSLKVVAEGVETEAQRECLELIGCPVMQGFLFAKPMPRDEFLVWLRDFLARVA